MVNLCCAIIVQYATLWLCQRTEEVSRQHEAAWPPLWYELAVFKMGRHGQGHGWHGPRRFILEMLDELLGTVGN